MTGALFPVEIEQLDPPNLGTADADSGCGADGQDYVIKTVSRCATAPLAEYVCSNLAHTCGIATPTFNVVKLPSGELAFGSVWDGGAVTDRQLSLRVLMGDEPGKFVGVNLARIFAFDLFVNNEDRHENNYLCVKQRNAEPVIKAMDYSRAWHFRGWPLQALPMPPSRHTMRCSRTLRKRHGFDEGAAQKLLDKIAAVPAADFKRWVESAPSAWLATKLRKQMVEWWANGRQQRIAAIRRGLKDGTYL